MNVDLFLQTFPHDWIRARKVAGDGSLSSKSTKSGQEPRHPTILTRVPPAHLQKMIIHLLQIGYQGFSVSITVDGSKLHKFRPFRVCFDDVLQRFHALKISTESGAVRVRNPLLPRTGPFFQCSRLTVETSSMSQLLSLNPTTLISQFYDVIAVKPSSQEEFVYLCRECPCVDIICIDGHTRLPYDLRLKDVDAALKRGLTFEISLNCTMENKKCRRHFISNSSDIVRLTRGKHILISSGATHFLETRSAHDLASIGILVGLSPNGARDALRQAWKRVVQHGARRRTIGTNVVVS